MTVFAPCAAMPALAVDEVHLWHAPLPEVNARAAREAARAILLRLLRGYLGLAEVALEVDAHGKPQVRGEPRLQFNLSHCSGHAAFAFARDQPLGVDIEKRTRRIDAMELARRYFHADEAAALAALPATAREAAFIGLWTHKEAVLKATGRGLAFGLDRVCFRLDAAPPAWRLHEVAAEAGTATQWQLRAFAPGPTVAGCLAWCGPARRVSWLREG